MPRAGRGEVAPAEVTAFLNLCTEAFVVVLPEKCAVVLIIGQRAAIGYCGTIAPPAARALLLRSQRVAI